MSFCTNPPSASEAERVATALCWLRQGFYAQAFLLLSELATQNDPAARFALGLCRLRANELDAAILCFEQALRLIKVASPLSAREADTGETYIKLAKRQIEAELCLTPMDPAFCALCPKAAEQTVLLALIHVYRQQGMIDRAHKLAAGLVGPVFEDYKTKLREDTALGSV